MEKIVILIILTLLLINACSQQTPEKFIGQGSEVPQSYADDRRQENASGKITAQNRTMKEFRITAKQFVFEPSIIEVHKGDKVRLLVMSLDIPHGIAIPEYGINERLDPGKLVTIEFNATKEGTFLAYCSVFCGPGHNKMKGKIVVT